jgi:hypothetical protein
LTIIDLLIDKQTINQIDFPTLLISEREMVQNPKDRFGDSNDEED